MAFLQRLEVLTVDECREVFDILQPSGNMSFSTRSAALQQDAIIQSLALFLSSEIQPNSLIGKFGGLLRFLLILSAPP